jgi:peptide/nickel transport system substrate-binding protein
LRVLLASSIAVSAGVLGITAGVASASVKAHTAAVPTVTILYGTAPDYLDPSESYTTQGAEADWVSYLGLYTYAHKNGAAGGNLIPALATAQPIVSDGGKTYTMTLRKNLVFSNGAKVVASDLTYGIERSIKLNWGGDGFYTGNIVGAAAYAAGKSKTISGIVTNDATGTNSPPPGVGPYMIKDVVPDKSWVGEINPYYAKEAIPGIPVASVQVDAKVESDTTVETEDVLNNTADLFDTGDQIAPSLLSQIKSQDADRFSEIPVVQNFYFFLNTTTKPFNNQLVREAVNYAIDRRVLSKLDGGNLIPGCYFLPIGLVGHPTKPCPYGNPDAAPDVAKAKALIAKSGDKGLPVTVWSEERQPRTQFCTYWASVLTELGFKVTIKSVSDADYFPTIGNLKNDPQTGFADWDEDFPNPIDFYLLLTKAGIQSTNNENFSQVDDPHIESVTAKLGAVLSSQLSTIAAQWQALDYYTAQKAYEVVFGYETWPKFASNKVDYGALVIQPSYGWDWTSIKLAN